MSAIDNKLSPTPSCVLFYFFPIEPFLKQPFLRYTAYLKTVTVRAQFFLKKNPSLKIAPVQKQHLYEKRLSIHLITTSY